jgi:hypothetical protein
MSALESRSTGQVFEDHLKRREERDLEGDLEQNYAADVVLLCEHGPRQGRDAIRASAAALGRQLPDAVFEYQHKIVHGEYAMIFWRAESTSARAEHGVDSFVIRDGRIVMQTVAYVLKSR